MAQANISDADSSDMNSSDRQSDKAIIDEVIRRIVQAYPKRPSTSDEERLAQQLVSDYFDQLGIDCQLSGFTSPSTVHANFIVHFGLATLATILSPWAPRIAFGMHAGSAFSYWMDTTRRKYILRKLLPFKPSQNLLAVMPSQGVPVLRIVFAAHIDAAYTGWVFDPRVVKAIAGRKYGKNFMNKPVSTAVKAQAVLSVIDALRSVFGPITLGLRPVEWLLTIPSALTFLLNLQILLNNKVVPGANDNLSGVAALVILAQRFARNKAENVELVFAVTGCEEAGLAGANDLASNNPLHWKKENTIVIALDTISSGQLCYLDPEGETTPLAIPSWVREALNQSKQKDSRFADIEAKIPPVGGTDAAAFLAHGWDAVALTRIDPQLGSARHYHLQSDTPDNVDLDDVVDATDFAEILARTMIEIKTTERQTHNQ